MKMLHLAAFALAMIGALNWGLVGLLDINLVSQVLGETGLEQIVYILVGISAVYLLATHQSDCKVCKGK